MRTFKDYNAVKIAKYVKSYFTGQLFIQGEGRFEFAQGKVIFSATAPHHYKRVASQVNREIKALKSLAVA
ncbi:DUF1107 family protein [Motilimonas pumila]|uniref:DUF1107 family protein n=1 Tax=Motilimonas pumila TaxID=2303987 RepID=A0A418YGH1_9GAMM|nr:DUF1107 family protein [Motilimonas pumila]RJG48688.1 DUF1107 family protein [Motilimonas pumila]